MLPKVMEKSTFIGIDVSKATIDVCILNDEPQHCQIQNRRTDITKFFHGLSCEYLIVGMENTGRYNWPVYEALKSINCRLIVINPLHIKRSMGLTRGKNDKVDALRIAKFIQLHHNNLEPWIMPGKILQQIQLLIAQRDLRVNQKKQLLNSIAAYDTVEDAKMTASLLKQDKILLNKLEQQINIIEKQIEQLVQQDDELSEKMNLIQTVPGVGKVLAWTILLRTNGFTRVTNPRKLACFAGVVPFEYSSGSSVRYKNRVSPYSDKTLKKLLHLGAMSAIRLDNDLRTYYLRKVAEGKNKMSVLNAVRNKMVHRMMAVIRDNKPYDKKLTA